ncbi:family 43 glycosylhydrolase [Pontibacter qinzhouensis]|uniref:Family 43 glycosylhydrolase n=2 Tax=Pontibacter qinzhouensis TaxID=2603253 RepID=A0A5C8KDL9_9BACT|nr:family 43 glycosylhydrolase [Pontibacter qinzhouensis]
MPWSHPLFYGFKAAFCLLLTLSFCASDALGQGKTNTIYPGEVWPDNNGNHIQAHGGGITKWKGHYYWYGEDRREGLDPNYRYTSCYRSKDLVNWTHLGYALKVSKPDTILGEWVVERPKVYYNAKTKKFVMYVHVDGSVKGVSPDPSIIAYHYARVGVAISDKPEGPFKFIRTFRPLGHESRDIGQFIDDDGSAYLIFEDRPVRGFRIAKLSDDYLDVEKEMCLITERIEGGAIVKYEGLYYVIGSGLTGWNANPNKYATATSLSGPWSEFKDIAPPETNTYGSQSSMLVKVQGTKTTSIIFTGDVWKPKTQWDSRYLWMPLEIGDGKLWLPEPAPWTLNIKTGETKILKKK